MGSHASVLMGDARRSAGMTSSQAAPLARNGVNEPAMMAERRRAQRRILHARLASPLQSQLGRWENLPHAVIGGSAFTAEARGR